MYFCGQQVLMMMFSFLFFFSACFNLRRTIWMPSSHFLDLLKTSSCVCWLYWTELALFFCTIWVCVMFTVSYPSSCSIVHWRDAHRRDNDSSSGANIWWVFPACWYSLRYLLKVCCLTADCFPVFTLQPSREAKAASHPSQTGAAARLKVLPPPPRGETAAAEETVQVSPGATKGDTI